MEELKIVGKRVPKVDAVAKVTGRGQYSGDIKLPGMKYGKLVHSPYAHANVLSVDASAAEKMPGVRAVLTKDNTTKKPFIDTVMDVMVPFPDALGLKLDQVLFDDKVRYFGEPVAAVVADTPEQAVAAAKRVKVEYEPLPAVIGVEQAMAPGAPAIHEWCQDNVCAHIPVVPGMLDGKLGWGDCEKGFAEADMVFEDVWQSSKHRQFAIEPFNCVADYKEGHLTVWSKNQMPHCSRRKLAELFDLNYGDVTWISPLIGGAFGAGLGFTNEPLVAAMAMAVEAPVKLLWTREEDAVMYGSRHPMRYHVKLGMKKDGTMTALHLENFSNTGAYYTHGGDTQFTSGSFALCVYDVPNAYYYSTVCYTNETPCGAYRGYGAPQAMWAIEQMIDRACAYFGLDPVEVRKKNHKKVGQDGWVQGVPLLTVGIDECLDKGMEAIGWEKRNPVPGEYKPDTSVPAEMPLACGYKIMGTWGGAGPQELCDPKRYLGENQTKRRGVGCAIASFTSSAMPMLLEYTAATIKVNEDGTINVNVGSTDLGGGAFTMISQIAAESFGVPLDWVSLNINNTDHTPFDIGSHASRQTWMAGNAVKKAAQDAKEKVLRRAAEMLETPAEDLDIVDGKIQIKSRQEEVPLKQVTMDTVYNYSFNCNQVYGYGDHNPPGNGPPWNACFADVTVDIETGEVILNDLFMGHDIGRAIHPPSVESGLQGGFQQGGGPALCEWYPYDASGRPLAVNFLDYKFLSSADMPLVKTALIETNDPNGAYGAKSCGETGVIAPAPAIANAIYNAIGVQVNAQPITPEKILEALAAKQGIDVKKKEV